MSRKAEQLGPVGAQLDDFGDGGVGVVLVAIVTAGDELLPHLLAQAPVGRKGQQRIDRRTGVDDIIAGLVAMAFGGRLVGGKIAGRDARQLLHVGHHRPGVFIGEQLGIELGEQLGKALVDLAEFGLALGIELHTGGDEAIIIDAGQPRLFGSQSLGSSWTAFTRANSFSSKAIRS